MTNLLKIIRSGFLAVCIVLYTFLGSLYVNIFFPFFGRREYIDIGSRVWVKLILWTSRVKVTVEGLENLSPEEKYIYVANHQSHMDIPVCITIIPARLRMLAKKELFRIPVFGWAMWMAGHFRIDRENREKAIESLDYAVERLKHENISPLVYPEGTRSPDGKIHSFKKGAFVLGIRSKRPIVPVTIIGSRSVLPKNSLIFNPGHIHVVIDKPVPTVDYEFNDRSKLSNHVREIIEKRFNEAQEKESTIK